MIPWGFFRGRRWKKNSGMVSTFEENCMFLTMAFYATSATDFYDGLNSGQCKSLLPLKLRLMFSFIEILNSQ